VSRVLRIPFTVNWPNAKKRKDGRVPVMAGAVKYSRDKVYRLEELPAVYDDPVAAVSLNIGDIEHVQLEALGVSARIIEIIRNGRTQGGSKKSDGSRSAWTWDVICHLLRHRVRPEVIAGILLNPDYEISERYRDAAENGRDAELFVRQEITRAAARMRADLLRDFPEPRSMSEISKVFE
jgi:hypothetical protein